MPLFSSNFDVCFLLWNMFLFWKQTLKMFLKHYNFKWNSLQCCYIKLSYVIDYMCIAPYKYTYCITNIYLLHCHSVIAWRYLVTDLFERGSECYVVVVVQKVIVNLHFLVVGWQIFFIYLHQGCYISTLFVVMHSSHQSEIITRLRSNLYSWPARIDITLPLAAWLNRMGNCVVQLVSSPGTIRAPVTGRSHEIRFRFLIGWIRDNFELPCSKIVLYRQWGLSEPVFWYCGST